MTVLTSSCFIIRNNFYTDPEKCYKEALSEKPFDAIIIPGFPHDSIKGWDRIVQGRVYWALFLYKKGIAKNVIFSGSAVYSPYVESKVMALYAEQLGIPKENIFVETKAEHSTENLYYSYLLAREHGFNTIALATDPVQSSFLVSYKRKFKLTNLKFIPIIYDTLMVMTKENPKILADSAFVKDFIALPERESLYKRVRGTVGVKIKRLLKQQRKEARLERRRLKREVKT
ncbi:MAG: YdcF family protein [Cytophagaceae bacterium]|nr:YdcF family protein [Cytophagaceae bacterium]